MSDINAVSAGGYSAVNTQNEYELEGVGPVPKGKDETVTTKLSEDYKKWLSVIEEIMNKEGAFTDEDVDKIREALNALAKLAKEGDTSVVPPCYMNSLMLENLNNIFSLLGVAKIVPGQSSDYALALEGLKWLKQYVNDDGKRTITFASILHNALNLESDLPLQSLLNAFVIEAHTKLENEMESLEAQLKLTKLIAEYLSRLQSLRNNLLAIPPDDPYWGKWGNNPNPSPEQPLINPITQADLDELKAIIAGLKQALIDLEKQGNKATDEGTLAQSIQKVLRDLEQIDNIPYGTQVTDPKWSVYEDAIIRWLLDNKEAKTGNVRDNLAEAIGACEALNDTQKEALREVLYLYEQFVKMANELTQAIHKLMQRFAEFR